MMHILEEFSSHDSRCSKFEVDIDKVRTQRQSIYAFEMINRS